MSTIIPQPAEVATVVLSHGSLLTTLIGGEPHVIVKPAIESLGLSYSRQAKKLRERSWAVVVQTATTGADGKTYEMAAATVETFLMLLATVNEHRVAEPVRPVLVAFQRESAQALRDYWTRGHAVNPRFAELYEPVSWTWDEACAVARQRYGLELSPVHFQRLLRQAGVLKQTGGPKRAHQDLFWFTGSAWELHAHALPALLHKADHVARQIQQFSGIQQRLELEGIGFGLTGGAK